MEKCGYPYRVNDIWWWLNSLDNVRHIRRDNPELVMFTDASNEGWGAILGDITTGGRWDKFEKTDHINILELKAILLGLKSMCKFNNKHIRICTDNATALAYVKNMGGTKSKGCNAVALNIWEWAEEHNCWLSITHIPGVENVVADLRSRVFKDHLDWSASAEIFETICKGFGKPSVDLFASRLNNKLLHYVSCEPDPNACHTDAFTLSWSNMYVYCFPPFKLLPRVIRKIVDDGAKAVILAPYWPAQPWFPVLQYLAKDTLSFPKKMTNLSGPNTQTHHYTGEEIPICKLTAYLFYKDT